MIPFLVGILVALGIMTPSYKVGVAAWCNVNKTDGTVQCNYDTKSECEAYRAADETCVPNPEPGKQY